jgi:hypothetical protein
MRLSVHDRSTLGGLSNEFGTKFGCSIFSLSVDIHVGIEALCVDVQSTTVEKDFID